MHHPTDRITHNTAFVTPVMEHWLEWEIAQWVHHEGSIRRPIAPWSNALTNMESIQETYLCISVRGQSVDYLEVSVDLSKSDPLSFPWLAPGRVHLISTLWLMVSISLHTRVKYKINICYLNMHHILWQSNDQGKAVMWSEYSVFW